MENAYKIDSNDSSFTSKFSIDSILRKEELPLSSKSQPSKLLREENFSRTASYRDPPIVWKDCVDVRGNELSTKEYRYLQTESWLYCNHFRDSGKESSSGYTTSFTECERLPSPSLINNWHLPNICRKPIDSWNLDKMHNFPRCKPLYIRGKDSYDKKMQDHYLPWKLSVSRDLEAYERKFCRLSRFKDIYLLPSTPQESEANNRKPGQVRFSHTQSAELERVFSVQKYISPQERKPLARTLDLSERQVKTWFQNRRAKWRRIKLEDEMRSPLTKSCLSQLDECRTEMNKDI